MELYFIDLLWTLMSTSCLFLYFSERIFRLTGNQKLYNELAYFGKTRMAQTGVPKAWFKHFYIFAVFWVSQSHGDMNLKRKVFISNLSDDILVFNLVQILGSRLIRDGESNSNCITGSIKLCYLPID